MNTMITLSGGLLAVLVLYLIGGRFPGLPPILRALLAGLLPLLAYFLLIVGRWPGLDVAAMHISVFLAAGLVLYTVTQFRRRSAGRMHWAPKLLIAFFMGLVVINGSLLYIANNGLPGALGRWWLGSDSGAVYSGFSGVVEHGQRAAKAVSSELSQTHRESELGWQVEVGGLHGSGSDRSRAIEVRVRDRTGLPVERLDAEVRLLRPGAAQASHTLALDTLGVGVYGGLLALPASGRWLVEVHLLRDRALQYRQTQELTAP